MPTVSNPATLQSVIDTFQLGSNTNNLFAYRRGQAYVPDVAAYSGVSTTQPALSTFAGLVYPATPNLPDFGGTGAIVLDKSVTRTGPGRIACGVQISLFPDGIGEYTSDDTQLGETVVLLSFTWLPAGFSASAYFAYMDTPTGDPFTSGAIATTVPLSSGETWALRVSTLSSDSKGLFSTPGLRIKDSAGNDLISKPVTMTVSVS